MASFPGINRPRKLVTLMLSFAGGCCGICYLLGCGVLAGVNESHLLSKEVACTDIMERVKKKRTKTSAQLTYVTMSNDIGGYSPGGRVRAGDADTELPCQGSVALKKKGERARDKPSAEEF